MNGSSICSHKTLAHIINKYIYTHTACTKLLHGPYVISTNLIKVQDASSGESGDRFKMKVGDHQVKCN